MANYNDYLKYLQHVDNTTKQDVTAKIEALNDEIAKLRNALTNLNKVKDDLSGDLTKVKLQLNEHIDQINMKEVELKIAAKQLAALENETAKTVGKKNNEIQQLQNDLKNSENEGAKLFSEKQALENQLSKANIEIENLNDTIYDLDSTIDDLEKGISKKHRRTLLILSAVIAVLTGILVLLLFSNKPAKKSGKANITNDSIDVTTTVGNHIVERDSETTFVYWGEMKNGLPNGKGNAQYSDGKRYDGDFENGFRHGKGIMTFPDGVVYEGDYVNDIAEGQGEIRYATGERYNGEWKNNNMNGQGTFYDKNGNILFSGTWKDGEAVIN